MLKCSSVGFSLIFGYKRVGACTSKEAITSEYSDEVFLFTSGIWKEGAKNVINKVLENLQRNSGMIPRLVLPDGGKLKFYQNSEEEGPG